MKENKELIQLATNFKPFDYGFILEIERQALKQLADYLATSEIAEGSEIWAKEIRLAIKLLDITENFQEFIPYVNVKNWSRFIPKQNNFNTNSSKIMLREEKAWFLYNKIRYERMREWWD